MFRGSEATARSIVKHGQCSPTVSGLQSKKQRACLLDVLLGTAIGSPLQATVVGRSGPHTKTKDFANRFMAAWSIVVSSIRGILIDVLPCAGAVDDTQSGHLCAGLAREVVSRSPRQGITVAIREAKTRHASVTADGVDDERDAVGDLKDGVLRAHVGPHPARSNRQQRARIVRMPG